MSMFDEEDEPIEISYSKYMQMSVGALRTLCSKYGIPFHFGTKKRDLAMNIIPNAMANGDLLEQFYQSLHPKEQKILKYIVYYQGHNLRMDIKKKFKFDILSLKKDDKDIYVWWLELLLDNEQMDEDIRLYFLSFLEESGAEKYMPDKSVATPITLTTLNRVTVDKLDNNYQPISQKLIITEAQDIASAIRIIYRLAKDSKIKITQKRTLAVRSSKLLQENLPLDSFNYILLLNFLMDNRYLTTPQLKLPTQAFDTLVSDDDGMLIKRLFEKFMATKIQLEFNYVIFRTQPVEKDLISKFRSTIIDIIKNSSSHEWISIDSIVDQIPLNSKTLRQITNNYDYCYNFDLSNHSHYNRIKDLKIVVRYFIKSFIGFTHNLGLFDIARTDKDSFVREDLDLLSLFYSSPFASIEYARLSDLGRFVLDIDKDYKGKENFLLTLSPYTYDITVEKPNALSALFLSQISTKVDENTYHTDIKTFMGNINSSKDYRRTKELFLEKSDTMPQHWEKFFETMDARIEAADIVSHSAILVEIKNPKEMRHIIASNPKLQEKILKADQLHIVILKENLAYVKKVFKAYGVIL